MLAMERKRKMIIFDMDGVLFDSTKLVKDHVLSLFPGLTSEMLKELLFGNFHEEVKKVEHLRIKETDEEKELRKQDYSERKANTPMYAGAKEFLEGLHLSGYTIALNTSAYERNTMPLLEKTDTRKFFEFLGTAEVSKSKADKFKIMEEKFGFKNEEVLFVTDTLGDLREAEIAGIPTVCVTWGAHDREFFTREKHKNLVAIVDSFEELKKFV